MLTNIVPYLDPHMFLIFPFCDPPPPTEVGGIMAFLCLHEMLPLALEYSGRRLAIAAVFVGMAVMSASLQLLAMAVPGDISI